MRSARLALSLPTMSTSTAASTPSVRHSQMHPSASAFAEALEPDTVRQGSTGVFAVSLKLHPATRTQERGKSNKDTTK